MVHLSQLLTLAVATLAAALPVELDNELEKRTVGTATARLFANDGCSGMS